MVHSSFRNFCFRNRFVSKMLGAAYDRAGNCVLDVFCGIYKSWSFWTKSRLFPRLSMAGFMIGND